MSKEKLPKILSHGAMAVGGAAVAYALQRSRVESAQRNEKIARETAGRDPLTGLVTRASLYKAYDRLATTSRSGQRRSDRGGSMTAARHGLLILDIDHFKAVNDTYGHKTGDIVLRNISKTLTDKLREEDIVARWGGEEIVALLQGVSEAKVFEIAEELRVAIKGSGQVTASFGVTEVNPCLTLDENIDCADQALYQAKKAGRDQTIIFQPAIIAANPVAS